jgi:toxin FitB
MAYLLDTNVISELRKTNCHPAVEDWISSVDQGSIYISLFSVGEIRRGIEISRRRGDLVKVKLLEKWLGNLLDAHADRIAGHTLAVAQEWGRMNAIRPLPAIDAFLAATAKANGWTLVTRNSKDVEGAGVTVLNPFEWPLG